MVKHFGPDVRIYLTGISMGASTVLMAAGKPLPKNVVGIIADCGFTSARQIMYEVIRGMGLPPKFCFPFVKLGARIFGHFDLEETSALEAMEKCDLPVFFVHGEGDDFVPCWMSRTMFQACKSPKYLFTVPGSGHGLAYPADKEGYLKAARSFFAD